MWRYLRSAFFLRPAVPGIGPLPLNLIILGGLAILGFAEPAFWLVGIGAETLYLAGLATNHRFQALVDGLAMQTGDDDTPSKKNALVSQLTPPAQHKLVYLEQRCARALDLYRKQEVEPYIVDSNREALEKLSWLYLKLLLAQQYLTSEQSQITASALRQQLASLQKDVADPKISSSLRESKTATLQILQKRLDNLERRQQSLTEIDADLTRIEAQVELANENASMSGQPQAVSSNITLVSHLLDPSMFGSAESTIADLDRAYAGPQAQAS